MKKKEMKARIAELEARIDTLEALLRLHRAPQNPMPYVAPTPLPSSPDWPHWPKIWCSSGTDAPQARFGSIT